MREEYQHMTGLSLGNNQNKQHEWGTDPTLYTVQCAFYITTLDTWSACRRSGLDLSQHEAVSIPHFLPLSNSDQILPRSNQRHQWY